MNYDDLLLRACDAIDAEKQPSPIEVKRQQEEAERNEKRIRIARLLKDALDIKENAELPPAIVTQRDCIFRGKVVFYVEQAAFVGRLANTSHPSSIVLLNGLNTVDIAFLYTPEDCRLLGWNFDCDYDVLSRQYVICIDYTYTNW